ncbi:hypothetical protein [Neorhizobium tomejilense]|uniref:hypothetical protein n=1 Tax=Neorhizobium tomejilense TaxID=2093828 RepID=UPI000CF9811B|nr:hypothetical protein [Neorhizobium tomejilense]
MQPNQNPGLPSEDRASNNGAHVLATAYQETSLGKEGRGASPAPTESLRRPAFVLRFGRSAIEAAAKIAAAGEGEVVDVWIALDSLVHRKNRELCLAGVAPLQTPTLRRFKALVEGRRQIDEGSQ